MSKVVTPLPGLVQILARYTVDPDTGNHPENVTWWLQRAPVGLTQANLVSIAAVFDSKWSVMWSDVGANARQYVGSVVTDFSNTFGLSYSSVGSYSAHSGQQTGLTPPNCACLISFKTGERYRGGHFRTYLPWLGQANVSTTDPSMLTPASVSACQADYVLIEPAMNGIGIGGGLTQRMYRHRYNPALARLDPISLLTVQPMIATQRRRIRKSPHK